MVKEIQTVNWFGTTKDNIIYVTRTPPLKAAQGAGEWILRQGVSNILI